MRNIILSITFSMLSLFIIGCGNNAPTTPTEKDYAANGISSYYISKGLKFFSVDGKEYTLNFDNGGITGLTKSNDSSPVNFDKSTIYSKEADGEPLSANSRIYVIYGNGYKGTIVLPYNSDTALGHVRIINTTDSKVEIEGLIDVDRIQQRKQINKVPGTWKGKYGITDVTLTVDTDFVTLQEGNKTYKIPGNFFMLGKDSAGNIQHKIYGNIYTSTTISSVNGTFNQYNVSFMIIHSSYDAVIDNNKVTGYKDFTSGDPIAHQYTLTEQLTQ